MAFYVYCECGVPLAVSAGDAGSSVACTCGRPVVVPLLVELQDGSILLSAATIERRIRRMIANSQLPHDEICARCGDKMAARVVKAIVECERSRVRASGGLRYIWIPFIGHFMWREAERIEVFGRDTDMPAPIGLCPDCEKQLGEPRVWPYWLTGILLGAVGLVLLFMIYWSSLIVLALSFVLPYWLYHRAVKRQQRALKDLLRVEPVYGQLLDRYPYGTVMLPKVQ